MNIYRRIVRCKTLLHQRWRDYRQFRCLDNYSGNANEPILVYQMGKVASTSIYNSLKSHGFCAFHAHILNFPREENIPDGLEQAVKAGRKLRERLIDKRVPLSIITLTRDPVARNISAYFQNLDLFHGKRDAHRDVSTATLISKFMDGYDHTIPLTWFDRELGEVTGINVYDYEFPKNEGFQVITRGTVRLLIMHVELADEAKTNVIRGFIGRPDFKLEQHNTSSSKKYSAQYKNFVNEIKLPHSYVENLLDSKYSRHFYSGSDLMCFRKKWLEEAK